MTNSQRKMRGYRTEEWNCKTLLTHCKKTTSYTLSRQSKTPLEHPKTQPEPCKSVCTTHLTEWIFPDLNN